MCRWMGSHFHNWTDYHGVAFSIEFVEWGGMFSGRYKTQVTGPGHRSQVTGHRSAYKEYL